MRSPITGCSRTCANSAVGQARRLVEDAAGDPELADVVQQRAAPQLPQRVLAPAERGAPGSARSRSCGRSGGRSRATWRRPRPRTPRRSVEPRARRPAAGGPPAPRRRRRRPPTRPRTPASARTSCSASTSCGSNQRPLRRRATRTARVDTAVGEEDLGRLRQAGMRASSGMSSPRSPRGWPPPSQCSSSARIASAVSLDRPSFTRDLGAAVAARRISSRVTSPSSLIASSRPTRAATSRPGRPCAPPTRTPGTRPTSSRASTCAWPRGRRRRTARPSAPSCSSSRRP